MPEPHDYMAFSEADRELTSRGYELAKQIGAAYVYRGPDPQDPIFIRVEPGGRVLKRDLWKQLAER